MRKLLILALLGASLWASLTYAQPFPSKPVTLVVPAAPGGSLDAIARDLQTHLQARLGQPVVVENRPGAGGAIGGMSVARSAPDGHTLLLGTNQSLAIQPALTPSLPYAPAEDLVPIGQVATSTYVLVARPNLPARTLTQLNELARSKAVTIATVGAAGSPAFIATGIYKDTAKADFRAVPYRGSAPGIVDVVGGQVDTALIDVGAALPDIRAGRLRPLAVTSTRRSDLLPDVPTFAESGVSQVALDNLVGVMAPRRTPASTVAYLERAIADVLRDKAFKQQFAELGFDVESRGQEQFAARLRQDSQRWSDIGRRYAMASMSGGDRDSGPVAPPTAAAGKPQWNAWFQRDDKVVERLELGKDYRFVLDIAALSRKATAAVAVSSAVKDELDKAENDVSFTIRLMLLGSAIEPSAIETGLERSLRVSVGRLKQVGLDADEQRRWQAGTFSTADYTRKASAGQMSLAVAAVANGCGSVAISVWDGAGIRPLDHLIYDFQVGSGNSCPTEGRLQAGAEFALSISSRANPEAAQAADAVFHIFEVNPNAQEDAGSIVWFVDRRALAKARASGGSGGVHAWRTESSIKAYVQTETQLPAQIAAARLAAIDTPPGPNPYADVAARLRRKIFSVRMPSLYGSAAREAENALARLINEADDQAVVLARLAVAVDALHYLPLGLLSARTEQPFLNKPFVTVQPLPRERFHGGRVCIDPWTLGVPSGLEDLSQEVEAELKKFTVGTQEHAGRFGLARTIKALGEQLNKSTTTRDSRAEGIVVLSHHADGQLWFDDVGKGIDGEALMRSFSPGSIALLSACAAGSGGALAYKLIDKLNMLNVDSMVVTPFPVNADFGTLLALNFIRQVGAAYDSKQTPTIAELYVQAWQATVAWFKQRDKDFYEMGLEFVLLGDPGIRLCAD